MKQKILPFRRHVTIFLFNVIKCQSESSEFISAVIFEPVLARQKWKINPV